MTSPSPLRASSTLTKPLRLVLVQPEGAAEGSTQADATTVEAAGDAATPTPDEARARSGAKRTYRVGSVPIRHDQAFYDVGEPLELTDAQAERLGHLVTPAFETPEE
mgnify:CR=1 FL=1